MKQKSLTRGQVEKIRKEREKGKTEKELALEYGVSRSLINLRLKTQYIHYGFEDKLKNACNMYTSGVSLNKIAKETEVPYDFVSKYVKSNGVKIRSRSEASIRCTYNKHVFDEITEESAYWIGFLLGDGSVSSDYNKPILQLDLTWRDKSHLEKFKKFLQSNHAITHHKHKLSGFKFKYDVNKDYHTYNFHVLSRYLVDKIAEYNIVPKKSFIATAPDCLLNNRDFWRGLIDSNGTLGVYKSGSVFLHLCGSFNITNQFNEYLKRHIKECPNSIHKDHSVYVCRFSTWISMKAIKLLYYNCSVYLERKYERAKFLYEYPTREERLNWYFENIKKNV